MRTDKLVYFLLKHAPKAFFVIIGSAAEDAERYDFKSVELKELAFRLDGAFLPYFDDIIPK